jgi:ABC-type multidrug transport system ATPase subunit
MLGPNGAGKTTTINMLTGFTTPTRGTATVEGFSILAHMRQIYSIMGVCPQHDILYDTLSPREHLTFYGVLKNLGKEELSDAIEGALRNVDLLDVIDTPAGTFSGGMKRRLSVAIALIGRPLVCYLDEPSTGLDPANRRLLWDSIKRAKASRTILLTTHSMQEAEGLCDRLSIFVDGQAKCIGAPKSLTMRFGAVYNLVITAAPENLPKVSFTHLNHVSPFRRLLKVFARGVCCYVFSDGALAAMFFSSSGVIDCSAAVPELSTHLRARKHLEV